MVKLKPLDKNVPIFNQLEVDQSPVVLVNIFYVAAEDIPELIKAWENDANWVKKNQGIFPHNYTKVYVEALYL